MLHMFEVPGIIFYMMQYVLKFHQYDPLVNSQRVLVFIKQKHQSVISVIKKCFTNIRLLDLIGFYCLATIIIGYSDIL